MGPVYANRRAALAIMVIGTALAVGAGVALSIAIARSLGGATRALHGIAKFELEQPPRRPSMLREVAQLEDAVARVTASLRSFTRYAPEEIVRDVAASGQEAILCGQTREVTALFCDLRGFTAFTERLPAEDVVAILNDHFDLLVGIIAQHGGFVVDFLGDAVFAVFGALRPDADHAQRAVACAIEAQRARIARNQTNRARGWPSMEMGAAISTGPAIVGNMGSVRRIKYGVVGSVVNVAARLETLTVGGQVLVADSTRQALGDQLVVDGPLEAEEKGVDGVMRFWEVKALRGEQMRVLPSSAPRSGAARDADRRPRSPDPRQANRPQELPGPGVPARPERRRIRVAGPTESVQRPSVVAARADQRRVRGDGRCQGHGDRGGHGREEDGRALHRGRLVRRGADRDRGPRGALIDPFAAMRCHRGTRGGA